MGLVGGPRGCTEDGDRGRTLREHEVHEVPKTRNPVTGLEAAPGDTPAPAATRREPPGVDARNHRHGNTPTFRDSRSLSNSWMQTCRPQAAASSRVGEETGRRFRESIRHGRSGERTGGRKRPHVERRLRGEGPQRGQRGRQSHRVPRPPGRGSSRCGSLSR